MKDRIEVIARTERRRKYSDAEKAAILAGVDQEGVSVRQVSERQEIAESLIYNWRSARRQATAIAPANRWRSFPAGAIVKMEPAAPPTMPELQKPRPAASSLTTPAPEELVRPHPGAIDIDLPSGGKRQNLPTFS